MICTVCYGNRPQAKRIPVGFPAEVAICTGCAIDMDKTLGYMALQGHGFCLRQDGRLVMVDLMTGESWPTSYETMSDLSMAIESVGLHKGGDAPPTPSTDLSDTKTPAKARK